MHSVYIYDAPGPLTTRCYVAVADCGFSQAARPEEADLAIAPLLREKLTAEQYEAPSLGTLIFHPSLLPRHRGPDAIKWALSAGESFTGVTWFWCNDGLDTGDICEQEMVAIADPWRLQLPGASARDFYERSIVPAGERALRRALQSIRAGYVRHVPQVHEAATYESFYPRPQMAAVR